MDTNTFASLSTPLKRQIHRAQQHEITGYLVYLELAGVMNSPKNQDILQTLAADEMRHYEVWKSYTGVEKKASRVKARVFYWMARILGVTFTLQLMERAEGAAQINYADFATQFPETRAMIEDEERHERELLKLLDERKLQYVGSIVLGLNDALVELTGALAGLSLALQNTQVIALAGLVTGIAAALSMASSEYLSSEAEESNKHSLTSALYTGTAYIITVILLILPYAFFDNYLVCLAFTVGIAILIIFFFNFYISVAQNLHFKRRFFQMAGISLSVAALSFVVGYVLRAVLGVDV